MIAFFIVIFLAKKDDTGDLKLYAVDIGKFHLRLIMVLIFANLSALCHFSIKLHYIVSPVFINHTKDALPNFSSF